MKTEVRVRHCDYAEGIPIGEVDFTDNAMNEAISLIKRWGIYIPNSPGDSYCGMTADLTGQFVLDQESNRAYFEVVINDDES